MKKISTLMAVALLALAYVGHAEQAPNNTQSTESRWQQQPAPDVNIGALKDQSLGHIIQVANAPDIGKEGIVNEKLGIDIITTGAIINSAQATSTGSTFTGEVTTSAITDSAGQQFAAKVIIGIEATIEQALSDPLLQ